jgi:hypothetical protein
MPYHHTSAEAVIYLLIPKPHLTSLRCALTLHPKVLPPREKAVICFHTHLLDLTLMRGNLQTLHPQVLPPPKWKLWLVIWFSVFTISLAFTDANVQQGLMDDGWLDFEPALFVRLFISVTFIIYACVSPPHLKCTLYHLCVRISLTLKMHFVLLREQLPRTVLRTPQNMGSIFFTIDCAR